MEGRGTYFINKVETQPNRTGKHRNHSLRGPPTDPRLNGAPASRARPLLVSTASREFPPVWSGFSCGAHHTTTAIERRPCSVVVRSVVQAAVFVLRSRFLRIYYARKCVLALVCVCVCVWSIVYTPNARMCALVAPPPFHLHCRFSIVVVYLTVVHDFHTVAHITLKETQNPREFRTTHSVLR